jgi:clan AA aspartic protease (TIGR02281 family)
MTRKTRAIGLIALLAAAGYGCPLLAAQTWDEIHRLAGRVDEGGSCYVNATADGVLFKMLVDTGSDQLVFNRSHLQKLGLDAKRLAYSQSAFTPNGLVRSAPIMVHELHIGTFVLHNVEAVVDYGGSDEPLLGMSVLKYMLLEIGRGKCELHW